jgi:glucose-1-phosphate adenylyltransferase
MNEVLAIVLAGGKGDRLKPLTLERSKPAVPFGGIYRIIDATLSNCVHSRIYRIMVCPQYRSQSLVDHLEGGWNIFNNGLGHFLKIVHPRMTEYDDTYRGTADAVRHNLSMIHQYFADHVLVLSADHIYRMDYRLFEAFHLETGAEVSIAVREVPLSEAGKFGVLSVDDRLRVTGFDEKPAHPVPLPGQPDKALISMGIYLFRRDFLIDLLEQGEGDDFGKHVLPRAIRSARVYAYPFSRNRIRDYRWVPNADGALRRSLVDNICDAHYWKDVGDLDSYWQANMDLTGVTPNFSLYGELWPLRTYQRQYPPVKTVFNIASENRVGSILDSIVSPGCIISGGTVLRSVLSHDVRVNSWAHVEESVVFSHVDIGRHARIRRAIIDKHNQIPAGTEIGIHPEDDAKRFHVTPGGVTIIPKRFFPPLYEEGRDFCTERY